MSRRPADKAAQNQQVIKNLLKLEANKNCADCKRNKHPRWASWNLGVFVCIRCSGIHRGMGTHISRVKSVDLDAWTDEQLQSIMKWGNARANRYWESKLASGHVPSDGKIENFIRTKYESKRWVMDGPLPDPSTLGGDGDEDVPLTTVQERARLDRSSSQRVASNPSQPTARPINRASAASQAANFNLIDGGDDLPVPHRASTTEPSTTGRPPPPKANAQPSQLLGGLDFLDGPPQRPSSTSSSGPGSMSRPDLKQSILSLYASKPAAQASSQGPTTHSRQASGVTSPSSGGGGAFGGLNDAFGSLTFGSVTNSNPKPPPTQPVTQKTAFASGPKAQPAKPDAYAALTGVLSSPQSSASATSPPPLSGGSFFDSGSKPQTKPTPAAVKSSQAPPLTTQVSTDDWGDFSTASASPPSTRTEKPAPQSKSNTLLDFTSGAAANFSAPAPTSIQQRSTAADKSVFNLNAKPAQPPTPVSNSNVSQAFPSDPWATNEWNTPDATPTTTSQAPSSTTKQVAETSDSFGWTAPADWGSSNNTATSTSQSTVKSPAFDMGGWGDPAPSSASDFGSFGQTSTAPKVQQEEDFGGWGVESTPARPAPPKQQSQGQSSGAGASTVNDDLFANVWG